MYRYYKSHVTNHAQKSSIQHVQICTYTINASRSVYVVLNKKQVFMIQLGHTDNHFPSTNSGLAKQHEQKHAQLPIATSGGGQMCSDYSLPIQRMSVRQYPTHLISRFPKVNDHSTKRRRNRATVTVDAHVDSCPSRGVVVAMARAEGVTEGAIAALLAERRNGDDPGEDYWVARLKKHIETAKSIQSVINGTDK